MRVNRILHPNVASSIKCEGESITIHSEGIFFAVDCTAGGHDVMHVVSLCLYGPCGAGLTLIVHIFHEFCAVNMDILLVICAKEKQVVICFLWAAVVPGA